MNHNAGNAAEGQQWPAPDHAQDERGVNNVQHPTTDVEGSAMPALNSEAPPSEAASSEAPPLPKAPPVSPMPTWARSAPGPATTEGSAGEMPASKAPSESSPSESPFPEAPPFEAASSEAPPPPNAPPMPPMPARLAHSALGPATTEGNTGALLSLPVNNEEHPTNAEAHADVAMEAASDAAICGDTRSDHNTNVTDWTLLLHVMQVIQASVSEYSKQQNAMNEKLADIEKSLAKRLQANDLNSVLSGATGSGSLGKGSGYRDSDAASVASVTPSNHSSSPIAPPPLQARNRGCSWHGHAPLRTVMTTDQCAPPRSNKVYAWVSHFYQHFSNHGLNTFGDAVTKAISNCHDPVSSACGATIYYSNSRCGRHTSIRCPNCKGGCIFNYGEEHFTEFIKYLNARKSNLDTDGPQYSIGRRFEGQMRDFAEFLLLKKRTGFEIPDEIEACCY